MQLTNSYNKAAAWNLWIEVAPVSTNFSYKIGGTTVCKASVEFEYIQFVFSQNE